MKHAAAPAGKLASTPGKPAAHLNTATPGVTETETEPDTGTSDTCAASTRARCSAASAAARAGHVGHVGHVGQPLNIGGVRAAFLVHSPGDQPPRVSGWCGREDRRGTLPGPRQAPAIPRTEIRSRTRSR